jgi:hypothetical protein
MVWMNDQQMRVSTGILRGLSGGGAPGKVIWLVLTRSSLGLIYLWENGVIS